MGFFMTGNFKKYLNEYTLKRIKDVLYEFCADVNKNGTEYEKEKYIKLLKKLRMYIGVAIEELQGR